MLSDHLIWMVCAAFYLSDNVRHCRTHGLFVVRRGTRWLPLLPKYRFLVLNRAFTILNPFVPWSTAVSMAWLSAGRGSKADIRRQRRIMQVISGRLAVTRSAGCVVFASLFVVGPLATEMMGIGLGLIVVAPVIVVMWLAICGNLLLNRRRLGVGRWAVIWFLVECAICPGYFANIWRRLPIGRHSSVDAIQFCAATLTPVEARKLLASLEPYFADLQEREAVRPEDENVFGFYRDLLAAKDTQD